MLEEEEGEAHRRESKWISEHGIPAQGQIPADISLATMTSNQDQTTQQRLAEIQEQVRARQKRQARERSKSHQGTGAGAGIKLVKAPGARPAQQLLRQVLQPELGWSKVEARLRATEALWLADPWQVWTTWQSQADWQQRQIIPVIPWLPESGLIQNQ